MAKIVGYFENNNEEMYSEGPYVLVSGPFGQGYRIEVKGNPCPMFPPLWVYELRKLRGIPEGWQSREVLEPLVDDLNAAHNLIVSWKEN